MNIIRNFYFCYVRKNYSIVERLINKSQQPPWKNKSNEANEKTRLYKAWIPFRHRRQRVSSVESSSPTPIFLRYVSFPHPLFPLPASLLSLSRWQPSPGLLQTRSRKQLKLGSPMPVTVVTSATGATLIFYIRQCPRGN